MDAFDLGRLSPYDFEMLCRDLFEQITGLAFEVFPQGRDQGIDLRHVAEDGNLTIVQCKHWPRGSSARLVRTMLGDERAKVRALDPARYLLVTSVELTAGAKDKLADGLAPHVTGAGDIYGVDQLVEELRKRPEIVERHFRLWLSSTAVLQTLLRKESLVRSAALLSDIEQRALTFVPTPAFLEAKQRLAEQSVCIVTGGPGIGKTSIAKMLAATYHLQGYQLVEISRDADEINAAWREDTPQFFYYDDFLGRSTFGDKLGKNEDGRLLQVIERVRSTAGKRLVMTTRDYLFNQAERAYGRLGETDLSPVMYFVNPQGFDADVAAKILYNLVHYSKIPVAEKRRFGGRSAWVGLVYSENFNPRLAERTLGLSGFAGIPTTRVAEQMLANFNAPERVWERVVEEELDDACLHVLEVLAILDVRSGVSLDELGEVWQRYSRAVGAPHSLPAFRRAVKELDGALLTIWSERAGQPWVRLHNPSVQQYLEGRLHRGRCDLDALIRSLEDLEHLARLCIVGTNVLVSPITGKLGERAFEVADAVLEHLVVPCPYGARHQTPMSGFGRSGRIAHVTEVLAYAVDLRSVPLAEHAVDDLAVLEDFRPSLAETFSDLANLLATAQACDLVPYPLVADLEAFVAGCARDVVQSFVPGPYSDGEWTNLSWALEVVRKYSPHNRPRQFEAAEQAAAIESRRIRHAFSGGPRLDRSPLSDDVGQTENNPSAVIENLRVLLATAEDE
ncbi:restriction endonuclease [Amycolatopsis lexingtonensis]|uniref:nSTAND3 domain-containing NTPase n=1 Tax=Amycolatopsis lexingtonensis TaxID=218822 RepID=UPI003F702F7E